MIIIEKYCYTVDEVFMFCLAEFPVLCDVHQYVTHQSASAERRGFKQVTFISFSPSFKAFCFSFYMLLFSAGAYFRYLSKLCGY